VEHDFFGIIDTTADGGLYWSDTIDVTDQVVDVELVATDAGLVRPYAIDAAAGVLGAIDGFDARSRDALVAQLDDRASVTAAYIDESVDHLGDSLLDVLVDNSGDIAIDVLRSLQLIRIRLLPENADEGDTFAVLVYSISPDDTDAVLVVSFDIRGDVVEVDTEE
jgi:hypothetical protein